MRAGVVAPEGRLRSTARTKTTGRTSELDPGEDGEAGDDDEAELRRRVGLVSAQVAAYDGGEDERIGERLRRDERRVDEVGNKHRQRRERERDARAQPQLAVASRNTGTAASDIASAPIACTSR